MLSPSLTSKFECLIKDLNLSYKLQLLHKIIKYHLSLDAANDPIDADELLKKCCIKLLDYSYDIIENYSTSSQIESIPKAYTIKCNPKYCKSLLRYHRDRYYNEIQQDSEVVFWIDFLDTMHCYLTHSFDMKLRKSTQNINENESDTKTDQLEHDEKELEVFDVRSTQRYNTKKFDLNMNLKDNQNDKNHLFMDVLHYRLTKQNVSEQVWRKIQIEEQYDTDAVCDDVSTKPKQSNLYTLMNENVRTWTTMYNMRRISMYFVFFPFSFVRHSQSHQITIIIQL